jgi:signal peptidase II
LGFHQPVPIIPFFNLTLMHNTGAAFSFLAHESGWQRWFFSVLAIVVSAALIHFRLKKSGFLKALFKPARF